MQNRCDTEQYYHLYLHLSKIDMNMPNQIFTDNALFRYQMEHRLVEDYSVFLQFS